MRLYYFYERNEQRMVHLKQIRMKTIVTFLALSLLGCHSGERERRSSCNNFSSKKQLLD